MPKVKSWGVTDGDKLTEKDLKSASADLGYTGPLPPAGMYRFIIKRMKRAKFPSGEGISILALLDGKWKDEHKKYDGAELWDQVVMTRQSASFVKGFADSIGVSYADLLTGVVVDENDIVTKIGSKDTTKPITVFVNVRHDAYNGETRIKKKGTGYQAPREDDAKAGKKAKGSKSEPETETKATKKGTGKKAKKGDAPF